MVSEIFESRSETAASSERLMVCVPFGARRRMRIGISEYQESDGDKRRGDVELGGGNRNNTNVGYRKKLMERRELEDI